MKRGKLSNVVCVHVLMISGNVISYTFETTEALCDYQVYELLSRLEPDFVSCIGNDIGYPEAEVNKRFCYGISVRRLLKKD
jgi:hypothetical protein